MRDGESRARGGALWKAALRLMGRIGVALSVALIIALVAYNPFW